MNKVYFVLFYFLYLNQPLAGYEVGNGGSVVVCRDNNEKIKSVELLDVYEERIKNNQSTLEFEKNYSESANWYKLISSHSPHRGDLYNFYLNKFNSDTTFTKDKLFATIDYGGFSALPNNCVLEQLVVQLTKAPPPFDSASWESSYKINVDLWNLLSPLNKNATVLHEIIYRERIAQCIHFNESKCHPWPIELNSQSIRALVGFFISGAAEHSTTQYFNQLYLDAGFRRVENQGLIFLDKVPDYLTTNFDYNNQLATTSITIDDFFENKTLHLNKDEFAVSNFFDKSFANTQYFSYVSLKYKDYELILPGDFTFKFTQDTATIKSSDEDFFSIKVRLQGRDYKNFLNVRRINIISNTSIEIVINASHKELINL